MWRLSGEGDRWRWRCCTRCGNRSLRAPGGPSRKCGDGESRPTFVAEASARLILCLARRTDLIQGDTTSRAVALAWSISVSAMRARLLCDVHDVDIVSRLRPFAGSPYGVSADVLPAVHFRRITICLRGGMTLLCQRGLRSPQRAGRRRMDYVAANAGLGWDLQVSVLRRVS